MRALTKTDLPIIVKQAGIKPIIARELHYRPELVEGWHDRDFVAITTRNPATGVLCLEVDGRLYCTAYSLKIGIGNRAGRPQPIICDLCNTWQPGSQGARISFLPSKNNTASRAFLYCADLQCSLHARGKTLAARQSRAQLRETLSGSGRLDRFREHLDGLVGLLDLQPIDLSA